MTGRAFDIVYREVLQIQPELSIEDESRLSQGVNHPVIGQIVNFIRSKYDDSVGVNLGLNDDLDI